MSEEKLYVVKNAKGLYLSFSADTLHRWREGQVEATTSQRIAHDLCTEHGGHVVTLIEEPKKVTVSTNEAQAIESLLNTDTYVDFYDQFKYLFTSRYKKDIQRLTEAIKNGYTVAKEKRYVLPMPYGADDDDPDDSHYAVVNRKYHAGPAWHQGPCVSFKEAREHYSVTQDEIDAAPDWVKTITPLEVTDDD